MEYSSYTLEQIMNIHTNYQEICNIFLSLTNDIELKLKLSEILYKGGYQDFGICSKIVNKDNPLIEGQRRISIAYLLLRHPETFNVLVENKINLFHGTNANALPNILKYGLNSVQKSQKIGINVTTGEEWSRINDTRNFVSLTDVLEIAEDYSSLSHKKGEDNLSFQAIIGTTIEDVMQVGTCRISSDTSEVGIKEGLPLENIKVICVPSDKVEFIKKLVNTSQIQVLPIHNIEEKFYYLEEDGSVVIIPEMLNELKNNLEKTSSKKVFEKEEMKNLMFKRLLSNMKDKLVEFYDVINGGKNKDYVERKVK